MSFTFPTFPTILDAPTKSLASASPNPQSSQLPSLCCWRSLCPSLSFYLTAPWWRLSSVTSTVKSNLTFYSRQRKELPGFPLPSPYPSAPSLEGSPVCTVRLALWALSQQRLGCGAGLGGVLKSASTTPGPQWPENKWLYRLLWKAVGQYVKSNESVFILLTQ